MSNGLKINLDILEMMSVFWETMADREKMNDEYFAEIAKKTQMKPIYNAEFSEDSVRKVLSAITNKERLNDKTQCESRFWNNNMRMIEDIESMRNMLNLVKKLTSQSFKSQDITEIIFITGHIDESYTVGDKLYINFFKIVPDIENTLIFRICGKPLNEYIDEKLS